MHYKITFRSLRSISKINILNCIVYLARKARYVIKIRPLVINIEGRFTWENGFLVYISISIILFLLFKIFLKVILKKYNRKIIICHLVLDPHGFIMLPCQHFFGHFPGSILATYSFNWEDCNKK